MLDVTRYFSTITSTDMIGEMSELVSRLGAGEKVVLRNLAGDVVHNVKFPAVKPGKLRPEILVHGMRARNVEQVMSYLSGDAHDQSKVQWFDGNKFHNFI